MKRIFISLGVAFLVSVLTYLGIFVLAPDMYVEKAFNLLFAAFIGSAAITSLVLMRRRR
jgi:hypothetical protein